MVDDLQAASDAVGHESNVADRIDDMVLANIEASCVRTLKREKTRKILAVVEEGGKNGLPSSGHDSSDGGLALSDVPDRGPSVSQQRGSTWESTPRELAEACGRRIAALFRRAVREVLRFLAVVPLLLVILEADGEADEEYDAWPTLLTRPLYSFAAGRAVGLVIETIVMCFLGSKPIFSWTIIFIKSCFGWPLATALSILLNSLWPLFSVDEEAWRVLGSLEKFWPISYWLLATALSRAALEAGIQSYINSLTLHHYEARAWDAFQAQKVLRKIVAACQLTQSREWAKGKGVTKLRGVGESSKSSLNASADKLPSNARATVGNPATVSASTENEADATGKSGERYASFNRHINRLAGPLEFGSDVDDAYNLTQARRRAGRIFSVLKRQRELLVSQEDGCPPRVRVDELISWAYKTTGSKKRVENLEGTKALFNENTTIDHETFVMSVERVYKEQRLLTASVASFDRINVLFGYVCITLWALLMLLIFLMVWGVNLVDWVIPYASLLISVLLVLGSGPGDIFTGGIYTMLYRPFDIGDRVTLSLPGQKPDFAVTYLVIKQIDLVRTHFINLHGEHLTIENYALRNMSLLNQNRSGLTTLQIKVQVPMVTPSGKVTELVDAIKQYIEEKEEWVKAEVLFTSHEYQAGHMLLEIWATVNFPAHEILPIFHAKSRLIMFIQSYTQFAGIDYVMPMQPNRIDASDELLQRFVQARA